MSSSRFRLHVYILLPVVGMFVAPAKLEDLYGLSPLIEQSYIYGDSRLANVVAVIVPSELVITQLGHSFSEFSSQFPKLAALKESSSKEERDAVFEEIRKELGMHLDWIVSIRNAVKAELKQAAVKAELKSWEIPNLIFVEPLKFSSWNGLLSSIGKLCRPELVKKYRPLIEEELRLPPLGDLGASVSPKPKQSASSSSTSSSQLAQGLVDLLREMIPNFVLEENSSLVDFGLDSMGFARLANAIEARFGVKLPLSALGTSTSLPVFICYAGHLLS